MTNVFYISLFGILGVLSRYYITLGVNHILRPSYPYATFLINIIGSFLIGILYVIGIEKSLISQEVRIGLMVGFLGGFTTFSSFSLEVIRLCEETKYGFAFTYAASSLFLGFGSTFFGMSLARRLIS